MGVSDPSQTSQGQRGGLARAVAAGLVLVALLVGVPMILLRWGAWRELEEVARDPALLLLPDDGHLVLAVLTVVGAVFWLILAGCVLVEAVDAVRFRRALHEAGRSGARLSRPNVNGLRRLVRPLVTAVFAATFIGIGLHATAAAEPVASPPNPVVATVGSTSFSPRGAPMTATLTVSQRVVTVEPGDSLWSIAAEHLGDGTRWREIAAANPGLIADPGLIKPGWQVALPDEEAHEITDANSAVAVGSAPPSPAPPPTSQPVGQTEATGTEPTQAAMSGSGPSTSESPSKHDATITVATQTAPPESTVSTEASDPDRVGSAIGVAGASILVAAGLATMLRRRRLDQLRSRPVGRRIPQPSDESRRLETALGVAASSVTVPKNNNQFASMVVETDDRESSELMMANGLAENFAGASLEAGVSFGLPENGVTVCVGEDERAEAVCIGLTGTNPFLVCAEHPQIASLVTRGFAMNMAVGENSAEIDLHLVTTENLFATFDAVECHHAFDEGVASLTRVVAERKQGLGSDDWRTMRQDRDKAEAWRPVVFCFIDTIRPAQLNQLMTTLSATEVGVVAVAAITFADRESLGLSDAPPNGLVVESLDRAVLQPSGAVVHPLMLEPAMALHDLLHTSASQETAPAWWAATTSGEGSTAINDSTATEPAVILDTSPFAEHDSAPAALSPTLDDIDEATTTLPGETGRLVHGNLGGRLALSGTDLESAPPWPMEEAAELATAFTHPTLKLLGSISLDGATGTPPPRAERACAECCGWLLEHPGTTATAMAQGLLVAEGTRRSNMSRLRRWLGTDPEGHPYLPEAYSGRIWLDAAVTSDWQRLCLLIKGGVQTATTDNLIQALRLVRGAPLADATPGQWHWAEEMRTDMVSVIRDIGVVVARRAIDLNDIELARWAASRALVAAPEDELLLCARAETEHAAGNRMEVERLVAWITRNSRNLGVDLLPETVGVLKRVIGGSPRQWAAIERLSPSPVTPLGDTLPGLRHGLPAQPLK